MKLDEKLELQAYLDGELSGDAATRVASRLATDPAFAALFEELRWTKFVLTDPVNEPVVTVPESPEFYWSKIQRELGGKSAEMRPLQEARSWISMAWRRAMAPTAFAAMAIVLVVALQGWVEWRRSPLPSRQFAQVESPSEEMGALTFRSVEEDVLVIWLYDRSMESPSESETLNEVLIQ